MHNATIHDIWANRKVLIIQHHVHTRYTTYTTEPRLTYYQHAILKWNAAVFLPL